MTEVKTSTAETKQNAAAEIKAAELLFSAVPENKRDLVTGIMVGMELAEQKVKTA